MTVIANIKIDKKEPQVIEPMTVEKYKRIILGYRRGNPVKFEQKKAELQDKFSKLGGDWAEIEPSKTSKNPARVPKIEPLGKAPEPKAENKANK